jgi:hypothetical protein
VLNKDKPCSLTDHLSMPWSLEIFENEILKSLLAPVPKGFESFYDGHFYRNMTKGLVPICLCTGSSEDALWSFAEQNKQPS